MARMLAWVTDSRLTSAFPAPVDRDVDADDGLPAWRALLSCRMKVTVFELLRAFEFEPAVPTEDIAKSPTLLARPMRVSDAEGGPQMPLLFRPYRRE